MAGRDVAAANYWFGPLCRPAQQCGGISPGNYAKGKAGVVFKVNRVFKSGYATEQGVFLVRHIQAKAAAIRLSVGVYGKFRVDAAAL